MLEAVIDGGKVRCPCCGSVQFDASGALIRGLKYRCRSCKAMMVVFKERSENGSIKGVSVDIDSD